MERSAAPPIRLAAAWLSRFKLRDSDGSARPVPMAVERDRLAPFSGHVALVPTRQLFITVGDLEIGIPDVFHGRAFGPRTQPFCLVQVEFRRRQGCHRGSSLLLSHSSLATPP